MSKRLLVLVIILIVLIIILISMGIFSFLNKNKPKIIETKTFSEIPGFSFEYPVFEGWEIEEIKKTKQNNYIIFLNNPTQVGFNIGPEINIDVLDLGTIGFEGGVKNPNDVLYNIDNNSLSFYDSKVARVIRISSFAGSEKQGFSRKVLTDKIIDSFKFINCSPDSIGAKPLSELKQKIPLGILGDQELIGINAVAKKLKEDNENPDDFYAIIKIVEKSGLNGYLITYHLPHKDDFKPENCNKPGNRSGKSRDMIYDTNQNKVISNLLWK